MSEEKKLMDEEQLDAVAGGVTANLLAAYDVLAGKYGNSVERRANLIRAGYDPDQVQNLVNNLIWR